ncbi:immunoglobulin superfamily containing leucine-rich repeat protein 2-like [Poecilia reticulata]|uniref:Immunoglobulin superfamily containing leucine-rich repeat protein 2-like n=1 Tax=Poecilia reticulata TaxID=8081 RepID=A0A3P9Q3C0_POERE|nr:PREDICTED: immunoglobulin superfamily containing leucine-rich repeat protein 2-like [Poecilia reticulata]
MAAADILPFALWIITFLSSVLCCPESCTCSDKYERHYAECSYRDLAKVPEGLPPNVTTVSLSANLIAMIPLGSFDNVTQVTSLWMARNDISSIEEGSLVPLVHLRNFDISHNKMADFPWGDLLNLTALELLKMNHNELAHLPRDAFANLKNLRSLRLNNNRFVTIAEGTFDSLVSLSHLQIFNNPFVCTCTLDWLRDWISTTIVSVSDQSLITCASPKELKGEIISKLPESKCTSPNVTILTEPHVIDMVFHENSELILTCEFKGNPRPLMVWNISSKGQKHEVVLSVTEDDSAESNEGSDSLKVFNNGTLLISSLRQEDGGDYSCSATNAFGRAEDSVSVKVIASPKPTPIKVMTTVLTSTQTNPTVHPQTKRKSVFGSLNLPDLERKDPTIPPTAHINPKFYEDTTRYLVRSSKCGLTANTKNISGHILNASLDDVKQYTFDFGVIALGVSETEATVRLNPLLIPQDRSPSQAKSFQSDSEENSGFPDVPENFQSSGLYLCIATDSKHSAVQWSQIKEGVNTYLFSGLRPSTNYSLCLTYRGEDCEVQVLFATRRRVPNLLIIISVSICLLTVSTVPLLGATCFHLVYKYRSKTYRLILKAKDQYHLERNLNLSMHAPIRESQRKINEYEVETESVDDGEKEADTEESIVTESFTCKGNVDDSEMGSEYSDRLPLGAEAVNITSNYRYPDD